MDKKVCQGCSFLSIMGKKDNSSFIQEGMYCRKAGENLEKMRNLPFGCPKVMEHIASKRVAK